MKLPDAGEFVIGGKALPLGGPTARVVMRDGLCIVTEVSSDAVTINDALVRGVQPLSHGDLIRVSGHALVFGQFDEQREPNLEAAILRDLDSDQPWLVYADWLEERGDPLGRRISEARTEAGDEHWLEGLWRARGQLEVHWRHGMIEHVVIREGLDRAQGSVRSLLTRVLSLRAATFLRGLVVDLLADFDRALPRTEIARRAEEVAAALPAMPALERLSLGYHLTPDEEASPVVAVAGPRFPRLRPGPIVTWATHGLIEVVDARGLVGGHAGDRFAASGLRVEVAGHRLALGRLGTMRGADELCSLDAVGGRMMLRLRDDATRVTINGALDAPTFFLLPGDTIDVRPPEGDAFVTLRFVLEP